MSFYNIEYKGCYHNELSIKTDKDNGSKIIKETMSFKSVFLKGFLISYPIIISMLLYSVLQTKQIIIENAISSERIAIILGAFSLMCFLHLYIHEFIHALFYPRKDTKEVYISLKDSALFVYCEAKITKLRFVILAAAPNVILGLIPFGIGQIYSKKYPLLAIFLIWIGAISIIEGLGDYYNIYNIINQTTKDSIIYNCGMHTYWIKHTNNMYNRTNLIVFLIAILSVSLCFSSIVDYRLVMTGLMVSLVGLCFIDNKLALILKNIVFVFIILIGIYNI